MRGEFAKVVGVSFAASVIALIAAGLQTIVVARTFGPSGKGLVTLTFLLPGVLGPLLGAGFSSSIVYFASRAPLGTSVKHMASFVLVASSLGLLVVAVLAQSGALRSIAPDLHGPYLLLACLGLPLTVASGALGALLAGLGKIRQVNVIRVWQAFGSLALVVVASFVFDDRLLVVIFLVVAGAGAVVAQAQLVMHQGPVRLWPGYDGDFARPQLAYALKDHVGSVLQFVNYRLDQVFVTAYLSTTRLGFYSIAVTLTEMLWIAPTAVADVVFPRSASQRRGEGRRATFVSFLLTLGVGVVSALVLAVGGRTAITLLFGSEFRPSYDALVWLLPGAVVLGPAKILMTDVAGRGHPLLNSASSGVGFVATIALDVVLIPSHGIVGAAWASSASYILVATFAVAAFVSLPRRAADSSPSDLAPEDSRSN